MEGKRYGYWPDLSGRAVSADTPLSGCDLIGPQYYGSLGGNHGEEISKIRSWL